MRRNKNFPIIIVNMVVLPIITSLLSGCAGGGYKAISGGLSIEPRSVTLSPGQTQSFKGSAVEIGVREFRWEVTEGDSGGTLSDIPVINSEKDLSTHTSATYTAPTIQGTYHLRLILNPQRPDKFTSEATIQVK